MHLYFNHAFLTLICAGITDGLRVRDCTLQAEAQGRAACANLRRMHRVVSGLPVCCRSNRPLPSNFDNTITVTKVEKTGAFGGVSVNGAKGLKGTQAYTEAFAHELLKAYLGTNLDSHNHLEEQSPDSDDDTPEVPSNFWEDARLCPEERRKLKK